MRPIIRLQSHNASFDHGVNLIWPVSRATLAAVGSFDFLSAQDGGWIAIHYRDYEFAWTVYTD